MTNPSIAPICELDEPGTERAPSNTVLVGLMGACLLAIAAGMITLWSYASEAGAAGTTPRDWPSASHLGRTAGQPTLVVVVHPFCPCSRATVAELEQIVGRARRPVRVHAIVMIPGRTTDAEARESAIGRGLSEIPGVEIALDHGRESALFGGHTSGHTAFYDERGALVFTGGITGSRGHAGANEGRASILAWLANAPSSASTPVFGCPTGAGR